jgi:hypothetical protein
MVRLYAAIKSLDSSAPEIEHLDGARFGMDRYLVSSVPHFATGLAYGDEVCVEADASNRLWIKGVARPSGNATLRFRPLCEWYAAEIACLLRMLNSLGCRGDIYGDRCALDVPAEGAPLKAVLWILDDYAADGWISVERACLPEGFEDVEPAPAKTTSAEEAI